MKDYHLMCGIYLGDLEAPERRRLFPQDPGAVAVAKFLFSSWYHSIPTYHKASSAAIIIHLDDSFDVSAYAGYGASATVPS